MGIKSRSNWLIFKDQESYDRIFGKKECEHEITQNIFPPICIKCNKLIEEKNESKITN